LINEARELETRIGGKMNRTKTLWAALGVAACVVSIGVTATVSPTAAALVASDEQESDDRAGDGRTLLLADMDEMGMGGGGQGGMGGGMAPKPSPADPGQGQPHGSGSSGSHGASDPKMQDHMQGMHDHMDKMHPQTGGGAQGATGATTGGDGDM
jgi:hypothetical protein